MSSNEKILTLRDKICEYVDKKSEIFTRVSDNIFENPEIGFREFKSAAFIIEELKKEGFEIEENLAGIPTAFSGSFGKGKPVIGILGEFDSLPNLSQKPGVYTKEPVENGGNGHGCGHNCLGAGSLAAAVAVKDYLKEEDVEGTVVFFGCPGEEFGCGKAFMAREGCFDKLDFALSWHPMDMNVVWSPSSLANCSVYFSFEGQTAHAAASPHLGRSALDAAELMNVGVNFLREHVIQEARIHYAFNDVGGQAPNVVQDRAQLHYYVRAPKIKDAKEILERVKKVAEGAAIMTETKMTMSYKDGLCDFVPNDALSKVLYEAMEEIGGPELTDEERELARKYNETLSESQKNQSYNQIKMFAGEEYANKCIGKIIVEDVAPYKKTDACMSGSTDVGDVSYVVPTAQFCASIQSLGTQCHTWQMAGQGGSSLGHKGLLFAGKSMALTAIKVLENPEVLEEAKKEHLKATGGVYTCPFPDDVMPSL